MWDSRYPSSHPLSRLSPVPRLGPSTVSPPSPDTLESTRDPSEPTSDPLPLFVPARAHSPIRIVNPVTRTRSIHSVDPLPPTTTSRILSTVTATSSTLSPSSPIGAATPNEQQPISSKIVKKPYSRHAPPGYKPPPATSPYRFLKSSPSSPVTTLSPARLVSEPPEEQQEVSLIEMSDDGNPPPAPTRTIEPTRSPLASPSLLDENDDDDILLPTSPSILSPLSPSSRDRRRSFAPVGLGITHDSRRGEKLIDHDDDDDQTVQRTRQQPRRHDERRRSSTSSSSAAAGGGGGGTSFVSPSTTRFDQDFFLAGTWPGREKNDDLGTRQGAGAGSSGSSTQGPGSSKLRAWRTEFLAQRQGSSSSRVETIRDDGVSNVGRHEQVGGGGTNEKKKRDEMLDEAVQEIIQLESEIELVKSNARIRVEELKKELEDEKKEKGRLEEEKKSLKERNEKLQAFTTSLKDEEEDVEFKYAPTREQVDEEETFVYKDRTARPRLDSNKENQAGGGAGGAGSIVTTTSSNKTAACDKASACTSEEVVNEKSSPPRFRSRQELIALSESPVVNEIEKVYGPYIKGILSSKEMEMRNSNAPALPSRGKGGGRGGIGIGSLPPRPRVAQPRIRDDLFENRFEALLSMNEKLKRELGEAYETIEELMKELSAGVGTTASGNESPNNSARVERVDWSGGQGNDAKSRGSRYTFV